MDRTEREEESLVRWMKVFRERSEREALRKFADKITKVPETVRVYTDG